MILLSKEMAPDAILQLRAALPLQRVRDLRQALDAAADQQPGEACGFPCLKRFIDEAVINSGRGKPLEVSSLLEYRETCDAGNFPCS